MAVPEAVEPLTGPRHFHTAVVIQISHHTAGRICYDKKMDEGKTNKEALRALTRRISNAIYQHLVTDARCHAS